MYSFCVIKYNSSTKHNVFLAVQDSSISDIVGLSVGLSQLTIRAYNHYNHYNHYRDSDLDLDWKPFSELVTQLTITDKLRNLNHDIEE